MHFSYLLILCLMLCSVGIEAKGIDCKKINASCLGCRITKPPKPVDMNVECRRMVRGTWIWKDQTPCDFQRLACENPDKKMNCDTVAQLAKMKRLIG